MSTHPRHHLHDIVHAVGRLLHTWEKFETTTADLANITLARDGTHGGDTPDPTYAQSLGNQKWHDVAENIRTARQLLLDAETLIVGVTKEHPETARLVDAAKRAARCADPVCDDNAVKHGYCERHWWNHRTTCATCRAGASA